MPLMLANSVFGNCFGRDNTGTETYQLMPPLSHIMIAVEVGFEKAENECYREIFMQNYN